MLIKRLIQSTAMHQVFQDHGWNVNILRDDSDDRGSKNGSILERMVDQSPLSRCMIRVTSAVAAVVDEGKYQGWIQRRMLNSFYNLAERYRLSPATQNDPLNGCAHVIYDLQREDIIATIEVLETAHNKEMRVIAFVKIQTAPADSVPMNFRIEKFEGKGCKAMASQYAHAIREEIQRKYLSSAQS